MVSEIKILHLCTSDQGGAATAALRLHLGLLNSGTSSTFMSLNKENPRRFPNTYKSTRVERKKSIKERLVAKFGLFKSEKEKNNLLLQGLKGAYETFSFPTSDYRVENDPRIIEADIVNLHWVSYFVNYPTFFEAVDKPIVWTFHDMNPFLGGFHYQGDKDRNPAFAGLESKLLEEKSKILSGRKNITIVTPSVWLGEQAKANPIFANMPRRHIPYGLDMRVFKPHDQVFARGVFNLPTDKQIILFVTERVGNYRKGFDLLMEAVKEIDLSSDFVIVTIGDSGIELSSHPSVISLGRVNDDHLLSILYSSADIFVLPSREDNFPNVMLESLACGTPVLGFATGGLLEVIKHGFNGILVDSINAFALATSLKSYINGAFSFDRNAIRRDTQAKFDLQVQAKAYEVLYLQLMSGQGTS